MGICIDIKKVKLEPLKDCIIEKLKVENSELNREKIQTILNEFGETFNDTYIILNNEYYEDGNPYYNVLDVVAWAFGQDAEKVYLFDCFFDKRVKMLEGISYGEKYEMAEKLGIEPVESETDY